MLSENEVNISISNMWSESKYLLERKMLIRLIANFVVFIFVLFEKKS